MLLQDQKSGKLVEVLGLTDLYNPLRPGVIARMHYGEEPQDPAHFEKAELRFPSGEPLPCCWTDPHYRDDEVQAVQHHGVG
ncbi:MAG: acetyltransferase [Chromatiaceae bacterium]|nr:MAG: acetyltransferase [Chromatiaceae bacterium]